MIRRNARMLGCSWRPDLREPREAARYRVLEGIERARMEGIKEATRAPRAVMRCMLSGVTRKWETRDGGCARLRARCCKAYISPARSHITSKLLFREALKTFFYSGSGSGET